MIEQMQISYQEEKQRQQQEQATMSKLTADLQSQIEKLTSELMDSQRAMQELRDDC